MGKSLIARFISLVLIFALIAGYPLRASAQADQPAAPQAGCILYVNAAAAGLNNGSSWTDAYTDLQAALTAATSGCQVWVAAGTYKPTSGTNQALSFQLKSGVAVYGGFFGSETALAQRSWQDNPTILSGDIGAAGPGDNSYHVVMASNVDATGVLDGFTIQDGDAGVVSSNGGGFYSSYSSLALADVTFLSNNGKEAGGLYITYGNPTLVNVSFINNSATWYGGMEAFHSSPSLTNIVFANNTAGSEGGGLGDQYGSPVLNNVTFYGNLAQLGNSIYNDLTSSPVVNNSILWGNNSQVVNDSTSTTTINTSDVQGGCPVAGSGQGITTCSNVINNDPLFVDVSHTDLHLQFTSPVIDAGNNSLLPKDTLDINHNGNTTEVLPLDRDGNARLVDIASVTDTGVGTPPIVDMGAYEARSTVYVSQAAAGLNNGASWTDAYTSLQDGLASAEPGSQVWVAKGTYKPAATIDRTASFQLKSGVAVYGGFSGGETYLPERDLHDNPTVLSGLLGMLFHVGHPPSFIDSYHVVSASGVDSTAVLDGFTITSGNANGTAPDNQGGGIYLNGSYPTLSNLIIENNAAINGAGLAITGASAAPVVLTNAVFIGNSTTQTGGQNGAGIYASGTSLALINATFNGNTAKGSGGGIYQNAGTLSMENDLMWGDTGAGTVPEIYNNTGSSANLHIDYSLVSGCKPSGAWQAACGTDGGHNLTDADPTFVNAGSGDLHLRTGSPAINHGNNNMIPTGITTDLDSNPRVMGGTVDLGAYETPVYVYVNGSLPASGTHDGKTWATAFTHLQDGLSSAQSMETYQNWVEVWVAKGSYKPSDSADRTASFILYMNVMIYGGFSATETARIDRNWTANPTVLTGDLNGDDGPGFTNNADNSYNVVNGNGTRNSILDGFTITGGNANGAGVQQDEGGGLLSGFGYARLYNLVITGNTASYGGGGLYTANMGSDSLSNVIISNNTAGQVGGGVDNENENALSLTNVVIAGNSAGKFGGGLNNYTSSVVLTNTAFSSNTAGQRGGGIYTDRNGYSAVTIQNSVLWGDQANTTANELDAEYLNPGETISYSMVQGCKPGGGWVAWCGTDGGNNLADADPLYTDVAHGNLRLHYSSPAVDAGNDALVSATPTDLAGDARINGAHVDLGAYELTHYFVNYQAAGSNDGSSWTDALTDLQSALASCTADCEIWVAQGTYKPTSATDRTVSFQLKSGVAVYGGFAGTETSLNRAYYANLTYLSGDLLGNDTANFGNNADNSYHVVTASGVDNTTVLDGLRIVDGNANGGGADNNGAGLQILGGAGPSLNNVTISNNIAAGLGGGVYSTGSAPYLHWLNIQTSQAQSGGGMAIAGGSPVMVTMFFTGNNATQSGGGLFSSNSSPSMTGASFANNHAVTGMGGAMANVNSNPAVLASAFDYNYAANAAAIYNLNSAPVITNSIFYQNSATQQGGVFFNDASSPKLTNDTIMNNAATVSGGGMVNQNGSSPLVQNSIFWSDHSGEVVNKNPASDKPDFVYALVQGCNPGGAWAPACGLTDGTELPDADPQVAGLANNNLRLMSSSPAINAGSDALIASQALDLVGDPRISGPHVDLGAYELTRVYVDSRAKGSNNGSSWSNAFTDLQSALALKNYDLEIWVAKGAYKPTSTLNRSISFLINSGQMIFGGFAGTETLLSQRDFRANPTILSGDLKGDDGLNFANNSDNSYSVVSDLSSDNSPILDGFTITGGNGNKSAASQGGGVYAAYTSPTLSNLIITGNYAANGGGIYTSYDWPILKSVTVTGNSAANGAGIYLSNGSPELLNSLVAGNHATGNGGGLYLDNTSLFFLVNDTTNGNSAAAGGGLYLTNKASVTLVNDLFWGDTPGELTADQSGGATQQGISYSLIQGCKPGGVWVAACGTDGGGNLADADPQFAAPLQGNWTLRKTSPAIDKGINDVVTTFIFPFDLMGNPRIQNSKIDLGAYEYMKLPPTLSDINKQVIYGTDVPFSQTDFTSNFTDINGESLVSITIIALPVHGTLYLGSSPVALNQVIPLASLGSLHYTPVKAYIGIDAFGWNASDGTLSAVKPASAVINLAGRQLFIPLIKVK